MSNFEHLKNHIRSYRDKWKAGILTPDDAAGRIGMSLLRAIGEGAGNNEKAFVDGVRRAAKSKLTTEAPQPQLAFIWAACRLMGKKGKLTFLDNADRYLNEGVDRLTAWLDAQIPMPKPDELDSLWCLENALREYAFANFDSGSEEMFWPNEDTEIKAGTHPVWNAVVQLERCYPWNRLPPQGIEHWKELVRSSRETRPNMLKIETAYNRLLAWVSTRIETLSTQRFICVRKRDIKIALGLSEKEWLKWRDNNASAIKATKYAKSIELNLAAFAKVDADAIEKQVAHSRHEAALRRQKAAAPKKK